MSLLPGILTVLAELPLEYRWTSRYLFLDRHEAAGLLKTYRKKWRQKMRGIFSQIFPNPNAYVNADAKMMSEDAEEALVEIESGDTAGGYYTSTVVVFDEDRQKVEAAAKQIEKAINNAGFTARVESLNTMDALIGSLPGHGVQNVRRPYVSVFNLAHLIPTSSIWTGEEKAPCPMYQPFSSGSHALRDQRPHAVSPEFARARFGPHADARPNPDGQMHQPRDAGSSSFPLS